MWIPRQDNLPGLEPVVARKISNREKAVMHCHNGLVVLTSSQSWENVNRQVLPAA